MVSAVKTSSLEMVLRQYVCSMVSFSCLVFSMFSDFVTPNPCLGFLELKHQCILACGMKMKRALLYVVVVTCIWLVKLFAGQIERPSFVPHPNPFARPVQRCHFDLAGCQAFPHKGKRPKLRAHHRSLPTRVLCTFGRSASAAPPSWNVWLCHYLGSRLRPLKTQNSLSSYSSIGRGLKKKLIVVLPTVHHSSVSWIYKNLHLVALEICFFARVLYGWLAKPSCNQEHRQTDVLSKDPIPWAMAGFGGKIMVRPWPETSRTPWAQIRLLHLRNPGRLLEDPPPHPPTFMGNLNISRSLLNNIKHIYKQKHHHL